MPAAAEIFHQRDGVDGLPLFAELDHALENVAVLREEKILRAQALDGGVQRVIVEQDGAENAAFGFEIVRERAFDADVNRGHLYFALFSPKAFPNARAAIWLGK